jgi:hypothetical protein
MEIMSKKSDEQKTCCGCQIFSVCEVRKAAENLIQKMHYVTKDVNNYVNIYEFVASDCRIYLPLTDEENNEKG